MVMDKAKIIERLERYRLLLSQYPLPRREISKERGWIQKILQETGTFKTITVGPPPMIGGLVMKDINPLDCLFEPPYGANVIPIVQTAIDEAIGVVESEDFSLEEKCNAKNTSPKLSDGSCESRKIFIVHGHDEGMKLEVVQFLTKLNFEPIVLNECPNNGQTIIEKLEANSNVAFAVILLSPCDEGRKRGTEELRFRARQNVVVELGYFVGKLGRKNVFLLKKNNVEEISDFSGVVYTLFDSSGGWKLELAKGLGARGFSVDLNHLLGV